MHNTEVNLLLLCVNTFDNTLQFDNTLVYICCTRPAHKQPQNGFESVPLCLDDQSTICWSSSIIWIIFFHRRSSLASGVTTLISKFCLCSTPFQHYELLHLIIPMVIPFVKSLTAVTPKSRGKRLPYTPCCILTISQS